MPTTITEKIIKKAIEILKKVPSGLRYSELVRHINEELQENINNIHNALFVLKQKIDKGEIKEIIRPERGYYIFKENLETGDLVRETGGVRENDFYQSFSEYLVDDLAECTKAISLGGNRFQDRWGTPPMCWESMILIGPIPYNHKAR